MTDEPLVCSLPSYISDCCNVCQTFKCSPLFSCLKWHIRGVLLISPHGIAMPKGFYFTAVVFLLLFFQLLISEWISAKLGHIFTYDCHLKHLVRTPMAVYPLLQAGAKNAFRGTYFELCDVFFCF